MTVNYRQALPVRVVQLNEMACTAEIWRALQTTGKCLLNQCVVRILPD